MTRNNLSEEVRSGGSVTRPGDAIERPDITLYMQDLTLAVSELDARVFVAKGKPPCPILVEEEFPDERITGDRVGTMASFLDRYQPNDRPPTVVAMPRFRECYVLWQKGISRKISFIERSPTYKGLGDNALKELWFLVAVSLVRARVLHRKTWFPRARMRTVNSLAKHVERFGSDGFRELRKLPDIFSHEKEIVSARELDMQLTQRLVDAAIATGANLPEICDLLITN